MAKEDPAQWYAPPNPQDPFGLGQAAPVNLPDAHSLKLGERRWGDSRTADIVVPEGDATPISVPQKQLVSVQDVPRVWSLRCSCTWVNFAENFAVAPTDDGIAAFTVVAGVGMGMFPHTYLLPLLAGDGFAEFFLPALPAQAIQVLVSLLFTPAIGSSRKQNFQFVAAVAPYTRLRHDE
jgi:hypothetical protein